MEIPFYSATSLATITDRKDTPASRMAAPLPSVTTSLPSPPYDKPVRHDDLSSAGVVVTRSQRADDSPIYAPVAVARHDRLLTSTDPATDALLTQTLDHYDRREEWGRAAGILEHLLSTDATNYDNRAERSLGPANQSLGALDLESRTTLDSSAQATLDLVITTQSGNKVRFSFQLEHGHARQQTGEHYAYQEAALYFKVEGTLSEAERAALTDFAKHLKQFSTDFFASGGETPRLSDLPLFENDVLENIDYRVRGADAELTLLATDTEDQRTIDLSWRVDISAWESGDKAGHARNHLQLLVAKHGATAGKHIQQDLALRRQQSIIDEQLKEGRASEHQGRHIKEAFAAIHEGLYYLPDPALRGASNALVTGLADYQLNFSGDYELPMQARHIMENPVDGTAAERRGNAVSRLSEGFRSLQLSQQTQVMGSGTGTGSAIEIIQRQSLAMEAAYFTPLDHLQAPDFSHQNFYHHDVKTTYLIESRQRLEHHGLVSASVNQNRERTHLVSEYNEGKLVGQVDRGDMPAKVIDVSAAARIPDEPHRLDRQKLALLDQLFAVSAFKK